MALISEQDQFLNFVIILSNSIRFLEVVNLQKSSCFFKNGSKIDPQNFRPIWLLRILSKIIERIIHDQTQKFLSKNKILYIFHSGFRKTILTALVSDI